MPRGRKHISAVLQESPEAEDFIFGGRSARQPSSHPATEPPKSRRKMSIRLPEDLDDALSNVRHERERARARGQLPAGQVYEKQDIIAEALKEWLTKYGCLS
jgi:hypothetical protein